LEDGRTVTEALVRDLVADEMAKLRAQFGEDRWNRGKYDRATELFVKWTVADELADFLTSGCYADLVALG
jgi:malate synthase